MRKRYVIDAGPLFLFFSGKNELKEYFEDTYEGKAEMYMSEVNLAELLYLLAQRLGKDVAVARHRYIRSSPIRVVPTNERITEEAALLKSRFSHISLADAFLIATAKEVKGTVITTDSGVESTGVVETIVIPLD